MKILIIEDDASIAKLYQIELSAKGFEVEVASDGETALAKIKDWKPNLALIDIMIPKINGLDVLKTIKANPAFSTIKTVMLTNFGQENIVKEAFNSGADDYLLKYQTTPSEVADKIGKMLYAA